MVALEGYSCSGKYSCEEELCLGGGPWLHRMLMVAARNMVVFCEEGLCLRGSLQLHRRQIVAEKNIDARKMYVWREGHCTVICYIGDGREKYGC